MHPFPITVIIRVTRTQLSAMKFRKKKKDSYIIRIYFFEFVAAKLINKLNICSTFYLVCIYLKIKIYIV